jgi:thiol-disulfide isomerase/thioredoxin
MMPLGTSAPDFVLMDAVHGKPVSLDEVRGTHGTVVMFICNHCPYVKHVQEQLVAFAREYMPRGIGVVAINSNDVLAYPDDAPEMMKYEALRLGYPFPYLFDETQDVARAYQAACTPDFFCFDKGLRCVYRGQLDDSRPGNGLPVTGADIRAALDALLMGTSATMLAIAKHQKPSIGCNIKWKSKS